MGTTDISLQRIFRQLINGNVGLTIAEIEIYLSAWPNPQNSEKLDVLKREYQLMTDYWMKGTKDPQLDEQYHKLLQRLYVLCSNISINRHIIGSSYLHGIFNSARHNNQTWSIVAVRQELENFVSEVAMLELEPEIKRQEKSRNIYKQHQKVMDGLFNYILTSYIWTESVGSEMEDVLLSPTIDSGDQQLIISAVMLSLMNRFDIVKFKMLINVYIKSVDEHVKQRALVSWALSIDDDWLGVYPEQRYVVSELLKSAKACRELTELQMQMVYALNAEKDTSTIQKEIMPDLIKDSSFRMTHNGIEEVKEDPLEDVLNPDASEQRMERLEESFNRVKNMQKEGADVFFGGFSQMKRFPFFYDMSNWFVPFYIQHPDISEFMLKMGNNRFIDQLIENGPFCNSDKYSFIIAFQQVVNQMPESVRRLINQGEGMFGIQDESIEPHSAAFIRRSYLMDIYRFFRLFPNRSSFCNPFDESGKQSNMWLFFTSKLFSNTQLEQYKPEVVTMLIKQKMRENALLLLATYPEDMRDVQYYLLQEDYEKALELSPDNERALAGYARVMFNMGNYSEAIEVYDRLLLLYPDVNSYMLNKAICLVNTNEYDNAIKLLYQMNYENPTDKRVLRVLAWALTCDGKLDQADKIFNQLINTEDSQKSDYQNYGYCLWLMGRVKESAECFKKFFGNIDNTSESTNFYLDDSWLQQRGISQTEIKMMNDLIAS